VTRHPDNPSRFVDDERDPVAIAPRHFPIHEQILNLLGSAQSDRPEPVPGTPVSYDQTLAELITPHCRDHTVAHGCTAVGLEQARHRFG
jgi:hypothetical protein